MPTEENNFTQASAEAMLGNLMPIPSTTVSLKACLQRADIVVINKVEMDSCEPIPPVANKPESFELYMANEENWIVDEQQIELDGHGKTTVKALPAGVHSTPAEDIHIEFLIKRPMSARHLPT